MAASEYVKGPTWKPKFWFSEGKGNAYDGKEKRKAGGPCPARILLDRWIPFLKMLFACACRVGMGEWSGVCACLG